MRFVVRHLPKILSAARATCGGHDCCPLGDMRIEMAHAVVVLKMLLEGISVRACERITGVNRDTICDLVLMVGQNCDRLLESTVTNVEAKTVEIDEIWAFVGCKQKHANLKQYGEGSHVDQRRQSATLAGHHVRLH